MTSIKNEAGIQLPLAFTFNASNQQVRTTIIDDQPYFCGKDVCACLGLSNHNDALSALDDDERRGVAITDPLGNTTNDCCQRIRSLPFDFPVSQSGGKGVPQMGYIGGSARAAQDRPL